MPDEAKMPIKSIPLYKSTILHDLDANATIAHVKGFCPMPNGSVVRAIPEGEVKAREWRVVRTRLNVGQDATLVIDCRVRTGSDDK